MPSKTNASECSIDVVRLAGYRAALAGASLATSADASVVELSFDPGSAPYDFNSFVDVLDRTNFIGILFQ